MKQLLIFAFSFVLLTGCLNRPERIVRSEIFVRHGTNELRISNPKDVEFEDAMISPVDGVVRIKKYRSSASVPALHAAEEQARSQAQIFGELRQDAKEWRDTALRAYGLPVQHSEAIPPLLSVETQRSPVLSEPGKTNSIK